MNASPPIRFSLAFAIVLAFVPKIIVSAIALLAATGPQEPLPNFFETYLFPLFLLCPLICIGCSMFSSVLLFRRRTAFAVTAGVLVLICNAFISLVITFMVLFGVPE